MNSEGGKEELKNYISNINVQLGLEEEEDILKIEDLKPIESKKFLRKLYMNSLIGVSSYK